MCTVTYIPIATAQKSHSLETAEVLNFIFTSNRDESTSREAAILPSQVEISGKKVLIPIDPVGQGSWIALQENGTTVCLLNGGFEAHVPNPPYKHSRGLVVLHYFKFRNTVEFVDQYDFEHLEPFTLIVAGHNQLTELKWDGKKMHCTNLDVKLPHIWSSATLYAPDIILNRKKHFERWLLENAYLLASNPNLIFDFHQFKGTANVEENIEINRGNKLRTVSITSIQNTSKLNLMQYRDLINNQSKTIEFGIY
ncbi:MAG: NRDE family protein [Cytophagales bacterium]